MTAIKRDKGIRDWSHLIPGQGGVLDQLDSVIFAAPVSITLRPLSGQADAGPRSSPRNPLDPAVRAGDARQEWQGG